MKDYLALPTGDIVPAGGGDPPPGALRFYAAYDAGGHFAGIAAEGAAKGYADMVRVMFGYSEPCHCIVGIGVVSMRETPGIGDRILTDKDFLANFKALDVRLKDDLSALANEVKVVKHGTKTQALADRRDLRRHGHFARGGQGHQRRGATAAAAAGPQARSIEGEIMSGPSSAALASRPPAHGRSSPKACGSATRCS